MSLLETLIALALVTGLLAVVVPGQRPSASLDARAAALQATHVVVSRLQRDLDCSANVTGTGSVISLERVAEPPLDAVGRVASYRVTYRFDPVRGRVLRNGEPLPAGPFESVEFTGTSVSILTFGERTQVSLLWLRSSCEECAF